MLASLVNLDTPTQFNSDDGFGALVGTVQTLPVIGNTTGSLIGTLHNLPVLGEDIRFLTSTLHSTLPGGALIGNLLNSVLSLPIVGEVAGLGLGVAMIADSLLLAPITGPDGLLPELLGPSGPVSSILDTVLTPVEAVISGLPINGLVDLGGVVGGLTGEHSVTGQLLSSLIGPEGLVTDVAGQATEFVGDTVGQVLSLTSGIPVVGDLLGNEQGLVAGVLGTLLDSEGNLLGNILGDLPIVGDLLSPDGLVGGLLFELPILNTVLGNTEGAIGGLLGADGIVGGLVGTLTGDDGLLGLGDVLIGDNGLLSGLLGIDIDPTTADVTLEDNSGLLGGLLGEHGLVSNLLNDNGLLTNLVDTLL